MRNLVIEEIESYGEDWLIDRCNINVAQIHDMSDAELFDLFIQVVQNQG